MTSASRRGVAGLVCLALAVQCAPPPPSAAHPLTECAHGPRVSYFGPPDFQWRSERVASGRLTLSRKLSFDLPPAPSGKTVLVLVPGMLLHDLPGNSGNWWLDLGSPPGELAEFRIAITPIDTAIECPERPLPTPTAPLLHGWAATPAGAPSPIEDVHAFRVSDGTGKGFVSVTGRRVLTSDPYVFYEQVDDALPYTDAQYAAIAAKARAGFPEIVRRFGSPTDLDGNGHILVLFGRTVAAEDPFHLAHVQWCDSGGPGDCVHGEFIYVRSLDAAYAADTNAMVTIPDVILHETIHLAWYAHSWRRLGRFDLPFTPRFFLEGSAELFAFADEFERGGMWKSVRRALWSPSLGRTGPFSRPYVMGGLLFRWLRGRYGDGVDQAIMDAYVDRKVEDPIEHATATPEPLAIAEMIASLYFDGTSFGRAADLELPQDDVQARLPRGIPTIALRAGQRRSDTAAYTGHLLYEVTSTSPVHVEIVTRAPARAYVLVAQP